MNQLVSVIVPVFNAQRTLSRCIESLKAQDYDNYELIFVDDSSADDSPGILRNNQCNFIQLSRREGPAAARNAGARLSKGGMLLFTDSDCIVPIDWITRIVKILNKGDAAAVSGGYSASMTDDFISLFQFYDLRFRHLRLPSSIQSGTSANFGVLRDVFFEFNGFPENTNEDMELAFFLSKKYSLAWDNSIAVKHYFKNSLKNYLTQQRSWVESAVDSLFRYPELFISRSTYSTCGVTLQLIITSLLCLSMLLSFFNFALFLSLVFISLIAHFMSNLGFLAYLGKEINFYFSLKAFFVLILRNIFWIFGILRSFFKNITGLLSGQGKIREAKYSYHG